MATLALVFLAFFANKFQEVHENIQQKRTLTYTIASRQNPSKPSLCLKTAIIIHFQCKRNEQSCGSQKRYPHYHFAKETESIRISHTQSEASALVEHANTISRTRKTSRKEIHVHNSNFIFPKPMTVRSIESNGILYAYYPKHTHALDAHAKHVERLSEP